jgi:HPt (histidine-containing phosphotransfer) domain-containing protein
VTTGRLDNDVRALDRGAVRALADLLGGDREALAEVVDAFLSEAPGRLAELRLGADEGDAALAGRAAHTLKSNAATFGALDFASLCRRLEEAARAGEIAGERGSIDRLDEQWTHVRSALIVLRDQGPP